MAEERKRAKFTELDDAKKRIVAKRCYDATLSAGFRGNIIEKNFTWASKAFILDKAQYYVDYFANEQEKKIYNDSKKIYDSLYESKGIYYRNDTIYQQHIDNINKIESMEELDKYIRGNNPSNAMIQLHSLDLAIEDRARALHDKDGLYSSVKDKMNRYKQYKYMLRKQINNEKSQNTLEDNIYNSKLTLDDFLNSEYIYKQDYCRHNKISTNVFDKRVSLIKEYDLNYYNEYSKKLNDKRNNYYIDLKPVVEDILNNINTNKDYNIIDYFIAYKDLYKFEDLCNSCNQFKLDIRTLKGFLSKADVKSNLNLEAFMNQYYVVNNHEYSDEEKMNIYNYAKEHSIPFNWHNVSLLVARDGNQKRSR